MRLGCSVESFCPVVRRVTSGGRPRPPWRPLPLRFRAAWGSGFAGGSGGLAAFFRFLAGCSTGLSFFGAAWARPRGASRRAVASMITSLARGSGVWKSANSA